MFLLGLSACVNPPPQNLSLFLPEGYYNFDCPIAYKNDLARLSHENGKVQVQLLVDYTGSFSLQVDGNGNLNIVDDHMDYPGLPRSFNGEGRILQPGVAEGTATLWLKPAGPISRNHRKGTWTLQPASEKAVQSYLRKQEALEMRKARAQEAGLEIPESGN